MNFGPEEFVKSRARILTRCEHELYAIMASKLLQKQVTATKFCFDKT